MLDDEPEIVECTPIEGLTEGRKLFGAFCAYAEFFREGYSVMQVRHRGDAEMGRRIIRRLQSCTLAVKERTELAISYMIGINARSEILEQHRPLTDEKMDGPVKQAVIAKIKERYNVPD